MVGLSVVLATETFAFVGLELELELEQLVGEQLR